MTQAAQPDGRPPLTLWTKLLYGLGSASTGIKNRSMNAFMLIFYNQVVGLPPAMVSGAIMVVTLYDSALDPVVGQASDNLRSRFGRRHPFMYLAAIPLALGFLMLWHPPIGMSHGHIVAYLIACLFVVRTFDTFFELPSAALGPELAPQYNERTKLISWRKAFETCGGLLMVLAGYKIFMPELEGGGGGVTSAAGYSHYAIAAAIVMFSVIILSAAGTHRYIPYLKTPPKRKITPLQVLKEIFTTLNNHAFLVLAIGGMFKMAAIGARAAMEIYFYLYFWELSQAQIATLLIISVPGSLGGVALAPVLAGWLGKKRALMLVWTSSTIITLLPLLLRLINVLPDNDHPIIFPIIFVETAVTQVLLIAGAVLLPAMISDIVEDAEVKTGRRSEGLLFSADNLFRKFVSGIGVFVAGLMLTAVGFAGKAERGSVPEAMLDKLAAIYIPVYAGLMVTAMLIIMLFRIDKAKHEDNLRRLRETEALAQLPNAEDDRPLGANRPLGS